MALLEILQYPDERLRTIAKPVTEVNDEIRNKKERTPTKSQRETTKL